MLKTMMSLAAVMSLVVAVTDPAMASRSDVDTNAALKALTGGVTTTAYRAGYYSAGDGGDALYSWNGASSCTDDGGSCIQPNSGTGRWILNANGAQSIKVFGAKCDSTTDDTAKINADLTAYGSAMVPANSKCRVAMATASDGLKLGSTTCSAGHCGTAHLFGQDRETSVLLFDRSITPSFDFVTTHQFVNIVVASNIATVTTHWSHQLKPGQTVTISGSATSGLNGTKTIRSIGSNPAQTDSYTTFSFTTTGVANGTYTDPTHITGQSGINIAAIYTAARDLNNNSDFTVFEVDHLTLQAAGTAIPMTWIDMSGSYDSRVHDVTVQTNNDLGTYFDSMQVLVRCVDRSPTDYNKATTCFFSHVYDIYNWPAVTFVLQAPSADGNASTGLFERWNACGETLGDFNGSVFTNHLTMTQWYVCSDASPLSIDWAGGGSSQSLVQNVFIEGATTSTLQPDMTFTDGTADDQINTPNLTLGMHVVSGLDTCGGTGALVGQMTVVSDATSTTTNAALVGGGANTVIALCTSGGWKVH